MICQYYTTIHEPKSNVQFIHDEASSKFSQVSLRVLGKKKMERYAMGDFVQVEAT